MDVWAKPARAGVYIRCHPGSAEPEAGACVFWVHFAAGTLVNGAMPESASSEAIQELVILTVADLLREQSRDQPVLESTELFGTPGALFDSMGLVSLIAELEARVDERFGRAVILADDRAMSRSRSPFRTPATIATHVAETLGGGAS